MIMTDVSLSITKPPLAYSHCVRNKVLTPAKNSPSSSQSLQLELSVATPTTIDDAACVIGSIVDVNTNIIVDEQEIALKEHGFIKTDKICDTLQGEIYEGKHIKTNKPVVIKISNKILSNKRISIQDNFHVIVEEDILKEAIILHHLTVANKPISPYIAEFIALFESDSSYYLIMEKAGNINLSKFTKQAHQYIQEGKLAMDHWKKYVKYIFWQLIVVVSWLHNDMNCAHLELNLSNIVVDTSAFIINKTDGSVTISPEITVKLVDFGIAEVFKVSDLLDDNKDDIKDDQCAVSDYFQCCKSGVTDKYHLSAPQMFNQELYDSRKADMWSLGVILYELATGIEPYQTIHFNDKEYSKVRDSKIKELIYFHSKSKYVTRLMVDVMIKLLKVREDERCFSDDILKHKWLSTYYTRYGKQLKKKSVSQRSRNADFVKSMVFFPYYGCQ